MKFLQEYLDKVVNNMTLSHQEKLALIEHIRPELEEQLETQNISCYSDIEKLFGAPEDMAEELAFTTPYKDRIKKARHKQKIHCVVICGLLIVALATIAICVHISQKQPGYYSVTVATSSDG